MEANTVYVGQQKRYTCTYVHLNFRDSSSRGPHCNVCNIFSCRQIPGVGVVKTCFATFESNFLQVPEDYGTIYYAPNTTNSKIYTVVSVFTVVLLSLSTHAQRGLRYLVCVSVCVSVCLCVCLMPYFSDAVSLYKGRYMYQWLRRNIEQNFIRTDFPINASF